MKKTVLAVLLTLAIMFSVVGTAFAAGPVEYTIDVRNRTGAPVELNYTGSDGILRWVSVPEGVSTLTLTEGVYVYWADPKCGHIAGSMNISQQRQILWISCDHAIPALFLTKNSVKGVCELGIYIDYVMPVGGVIPTGVYFYSNIYNYPDNLIQEIVYEYILYTNNQEGESGTVWVACYSGADYKYDLVWL